MASTDPTEIERECERLIVDSAALNDEREWARLAGLYTLDGCLVRPSGQQIQGRDGIEAAYAASPEDRITCHVCANIRVDVEGPDRARATTVVVLYAGARPVPDDRGELAVGGPPMIGEFRDTLVSTDEGWRIARREARMVMRT